MRAPPAEPVGGPRGTGRYEAGEAKHACRGVMEREVLMTGIGGQGIQLASKILAQAASQEGRHVLHFGVYGGMIRGGPSDCTIVASDDEILAPPIVEEAWGLVVLHPVSVGTVLPKIRPGGVVLVNSTLCPEPPGRDDLVVVEVPATRIAEGAGAIVGASMVALGAFLEATGFVSSEALREAMAMMLPPHRRSLAELNERCVELGRAHVRERTSPPPGARAWGEARGSGEGATAH